MLLAFVVFLIITTSLLAAVAILTVEKAIEDAINHHVDHFRKEVNDNVECIRRSRERSKSDDR